eukprot:6478148-Amphidinium_carterae.1
MEPLAQDTRCKHGQPKYVQLLEDGGATTNVPSGFLLHVCGARATGHVFAGFPWYGGDLGLLGP